VLALAAKEFVKPGAKPARTYPAHDEHSNESVTVGVEPYDSAEKAQIFSVKWNEEGFLPIFLVVSNDGDQPISLAGMQAQLITSRREKLGPHPMTIFIAVCRTSRPGAALSSSLSANQVKGAVGKKALDEIDAAQFTAKAVEPHSTQSGFLFFEVSGISSPLAGARFYLTGLRDGKAATFCILRFRSRSRSLGG